MRRFRTVKVTIYLDEERDAEVVEWLRQQRNMSGAVVAILKREINNSGLDLSTRRTMLESVLDEKLSSLELRPTRSSSDRAGEDAELGALLDAMTF